MTAVEYVTTEVDVCVTNMVNTGVNASPDMVARAAKVRCV